MSTNIPFGAIIHFTNYSVSLDLTKPWKVNSPSIATGTGFHIGGGRIITNSHVIRNHTSLRLSRHGKPGNFAGRVLCDGRLVDLALVTVDDRDFFENLPIVSFQQEVPNLDDTVVAVGYPLGAQSVTLTRGVVSNVQLKDLTLSYKGGEQQLVVQIDAAINPGNSGGPVFSQATALAVGVAFAGRSGAEGQGFIIPVPVVSMFLSTYGKTGTFGRLPTLGLVVQPLVNPSLRKYAFSATQGGGGCCGGGGDGGGGNTEIAISSSGAAADILAMPDAAAGHHDGVLVVEVEPLSCAAGKVHAGDILMALDGVSVSEAGDVEFRGHERLPFQYIISKKPEGETMKLELLRAPSQPPPPPPPPQQQQQQQPSSAAAVAAANAGGAGCTGGASLRVREPVVVEVTLTPPPRWLPALLDIDYYADYAILGGLVVLVAGAPLIQYIVESSGRGYGNEFKLVETMRNVSDEMYAEKDAQCLLVSGILAHAINVGCNWCYAKQLDTFNGVAVKNIDHFTALTVGCTAPYIVLGFNGTKKTAVFETNLVRSTQQQILDQHKVPQWKSSNNSSNNGSGAGGGAGSALPTIKSSL